jgi:hypothetical protein
MSVVVLVILVCSIVAAKPTRNPPSAFQAALQCLGAPAQGLPYYPLVLT